MSNLSTKELFFCVQCDKEETDRKEGDFLFTLQLMLITITFWYVKALISMRMFYSYYRMSKDSFTNLVQLVKT
jgi:hypothetical protein